MGWRLLVLALVVVVLGDCDCESGSDRQRRGSDPATATGDAAAGDAASGDSVPGDAASGDPLSGDPVSGDPAGGDALGPGDPGSTTLEMPGLEWAYGGCNATWCPAGWYSSPAIADLDGNGEPEVIAATYHVSALHGADGSPAWPRIDGESRVWAGVVVGDLEPDGDLDIVVARSDGSVNAHTDTGGDLWSTTVVDDDLRGLGAIRDAGSGTLTLVATAAVSGPTNTFLVNAGGVEVTDGWPQMVGGLGQTFAVYNSNAAVGNIDPDPEPEIVVPSDTATIAAYDLDGSELPANSATFGSGQVWGSVNLYEDPTPEERGWGYCSPEYPRADRYRANLALSPAVIADVDGNGTNEVVVAANVTDCSLVSDQDDVYIGPFILNGDRTRFNNGTYDWRVGPTDTGAPLSVDDSVIIPVVPNPSVADLDSDGELEIVFPSYDGRVHAFWLDKTEHGNWPFAVYDSSEGFFRFASEAAIVDLDNDGLAEVIFVSWVEKGSGAVGRLHIAAYDGSPLYEIDLPPPLSGSLSEGGALAAPTVANVDADTDMEIVITTQVAGVVVFEVPGSPYARILWGTGRGNQLRTGSR